MKSYAVKSGSFVNHSMIWYTLEGIKKYISLMRKNNPGKSYEIVEVKEVRRRF